MWALSRPAWSAGFLQHTFRIYRICFLFFPLEKGGGGGGGGGELLGKKVLMYVKNSKVVSMGNH